MASAIDAVTSGKADPALALEAIALVRRYVAENGLVPDRGGHYLDTIENIAGVLFAPALKKATRRLELFDAAMADARAAGDVESCPSDVAAERWVPCMESALVFGMALGLGLAYYGDGTGRG